MAKDRKELLDLIQDVNAGNFADVAHEVFLYQYSHNEIYRDFVRCFVDESAALRGDRPFFLPIRLYKNRRITSGLWEAEVVFRSSGTTQTVAAQNFIRSKSAYLENCERIWENFYGPLSGYSFLCLLPGYLERPDSSLVAMLHHFVESSGNPGGFFLRDFTALNSQLISNRAHGLPTVLFGVTYAVLDFARQHPIDWPGLTVIETGGMKGTRAELPKAAIHHLLKQGMGVDRIHSEYGMTELASQAYSKGDGLFEAPTGMRVTVTEVTDPMTRQRPMKTGVVNITDLANLDTCAFLQTEDLGAWVSENQFELRGRLDEADLRGCNLMAEAFTPTS